MGMQRTVRFDYATVPTWDVVRGQLGRLGILPTIKMIDGHWQVPQAPGLGIEVDEAICARHPYAAEVMHTANAVMPDGTIVDW